MTVVSMVEQTADSSVVWMVVMSAAVTVVSLVVWRAERMVDWMVVMMADQKD